jgi:hypothetical protein
MRAEELDDRPEAQALFANLQAQLAELETLLRQCSNHWGYEDPIYRFYHHSFKVYGLQDETVKIVQALEGLAPHLALNEQFLRIVAEGTGKIFTPKDNRNWEVLTRPILEAFFHARFFLEMAVKYGHELQAPPNTLPSGWAALLYLYNLR